MPANINENCPKLVSVALRSLLWSSLTQHHGKLQGQLGTDNDLALHRRWFLSELSGGRE